MANLPVDDSSGDSQGQAAGKTNILLTDTNRWPAPARLAIALSEAGCNVSAVCRTPGHPLLKTRAVRQIFPYRGLRPLDSLLAAIDAAQPDLIVPCDDRGVQHLHELHVRARSEAASGTALAALIERSLGAPESFPVVSSRYDLLRLAIEEQIPVPQTCRIDSVQEAKSLFAERPTPWVLKADGTWGGRGVRFVESADQGAESFRELTNPPSTAEVLKQFALNRDRSWLLPRSHQLRPSIIAQSCIHGRPANCAVVCWRGTVLAGIAVEVLSSNGAKGPAIVVRVVEGSRMLGASERLAARLGLSGFFGLDFMIEEGTGATYLIEMNPRCTPLCHLQIGPGRDLVGALKAQLADSPYRPAARRFENDLIAYFPQALATKSEFLATSYLDIPHREPELVTELLHPWSERSVLGRVVDRVRLIIEKGNTTPSAHVFPDAISSSGSMPDRKSEKQHHPSPV